jgi:BlaI family transcriptional regulator, penicillinase repressor
MKSLTKAEEEIMQVLWTLEKSFVKDIIEQLPEPKPAYNTVSTIIRILEKKGFVSHESFGKSHRYFPLISKETYSSELLGDVVNNYFKGSFKNLVSFFVKEKELDINDVDEILKILKNNTK